MALTENPVDDVSVVVAGRYRCDYVLGRGGTGTVWAATDLVLHRWVALRSLDLADGTPAAAREQILREAKAAARLNHPGVVTVHDVVEVDGGLLLVTEYLAGGTLADNVRRDGPLDLVAVAALGARLAGGLAQAHATGVVHAHVQPADVLLLGPDPTQAELGGFGMATVRGATAPAAGTSLGTPAHLAPERIAGCDPAPPADVYGLGATLWFALTGRAPFERATVEATLEAAASEPLPPIGRTGPVVDLVVRALDRNPLRRPSADELAAAFTALVPSAVPLPAAALAPLAVVPPPSPPVARAIDETATVARPLAEPEVAAAPPPEALPAPRRRRSLLVGVALVLLGAALVVAGLRFGAGGDEARVDEGAAVDDDAPDEPAPADGADDVPAEDPTPAGDPTPTAPPAPPEGPAPPAPPSPPAADATYVDPQGGFRVAFPAGVAVALDADAHVTEATAGDLRIAVRWFDEPLDPAAFIAAEEERLTGFPGYERLALEGDGDDLVWTFAFAQPSAPDQLLHSTGRAFVVDGRTYAVFVRAADPAEVESVLAGIDATFLATP